MYVWMYVYVYTYVMCVVNKSTYVCMSQKKNAQKKLFIFIFFLEVRTTFENKINNIKATADGYDRRVKFGKQRIFY